MIAQSVLVPSLLTAVELAFNTGHPLTAAAVADALIPVAALVALAASLTAVTRWRLTGSALSGRQGAALGGFAVVLVVGRQTALGGAVGGLPLLSLLSAVGVGLLIFMGATGPEVDTSTSPGRDFVAAAAPILLVTGVVRWLVGPGGVDVVSGELAAAAVIWWVLSVAMSRFHRAAPRGVPPSALVGVGMAAAARAAGELTGTSGLRLVGAVVLLLALSWILACLWWELRAGVWSGDRQQHHLSRDLRATRDLLVQHQADLEERLHDLRNAVAGMRTADSTLRRYGGRLEPERRNLLADALSAELNRLQRLIEPGRSAAPGSFDLAREAKPVIDAERAAGTELHVDLAGCSASGDGLAFAQVLQNLLVNARRYAPGSPVWVTAGQGAGLIEVRVRDQGPGIPEEERQAIFGRGQRGRTATGVPGDGLGLYISVRLLTAAGGALRHDASIQDGACFVIELPPAGSLEQGDHLFGTVEGGDRPAVVLAAQRPALSPLVGQVEHDVGRQVDDRSAEGAGDHRSGDGRGPGPSAFVHLPAPSGEQPAQDAAQQHGLHGHDDRGRRARHTTSIAARHRARFTKLKEKYRSL